MFRKKVWYIRYPNLRIVFGFHFGELGKSFRLQQKRKCFSIFEYWETLSWTYSPKDQIDTTLTESTKKYLIWKANINK